MNLDDAEFLLSSTDVWWGGEVPMLTPEQHSELKGLVHEPIFPEKEEWFQGRLDAIFGQAVRSEMLFQKVRKGVIVRPGPGKVSKRPPKKLSTVVRRELEQISKSAESLAAALEGANDATLECLAIFQDWVIERPSTQAPPPDTASFRRALVDVLLKSQLAHSEIEDSVSKGGGEPASRQMVRGLLSVYLKATGVTPKRAYQPWDTAGKSPGGERGHFLKLAKAFAGMVNEALPEDLQRERPSSLSKIVREEIEALAKDMAE